MSDIDNDNEWAFRKCDVCGRGFTKRSWESRHEPHEKDCPNFGKTGNDPMIPCTCDRVTHPGCCPECEPKAVSRYWDLQAVKQWKASTNGAQNSNLSLMFS